MASVSNGRGTTSQLEYLQPYTTFREHDSKPFDTGLTVGRAVFGPAELSVVHRVLRLSYVIKTCGILSAFCCILLVLVMYGVSGFSHPITCYIFGFLWCLVPFVALSTFNIHLIKLVLWEFEVWFLVIQAVMGYGLWGYLLRWDERSVLVVAAFSVQLVGFLLDASPQMVRIKGAVPAIG